MKLHLFSIYRVLLLTPALLTTISCQTRSYVSDMSTRQIDKWFKQGEWLNECHLKPHPSINRNAFSKEYFANKTLWDKTFEWLGTNDLDIIPPGRYIIIEGQVIATVSEDPALELEKVRWEKHQNFNDLQYIVRGKARMGSVPVSEATVIEAFDPIRDIALYEADGELYTAETGTFFIFTPDDVHRPGIKADGFNEPVKKIVIKIRSANAKPQ